MTMKRLTTSFFTLLLVLSTVLLGPAPVAQAVTPGALAPLGDQLGDVGQYYSNVGTSFGSKTYIQNTTASQINATIYLYDDDGGSPVVSYSIDVPALGRVRAEFTATDGQLRLYTDTQNSFDTSATLVGSNLHGVYHMKITGSASGLQVVTRNWRANASNQAMTDAAGIRGEQAGTALYLPEISIDRNTRWDTEIVVQNVGGASATVKFELHDDNGNYMNGPGGNPNNAAVLQPGERRIFLASQLAYAPNNGALIELNGTFGMRLISTGANVVAYTRVFRHGTDHAEDGALEAFMYTQPPVVNELLAPEFIEGGGNTSRARIMNPSSSNTTVDYWVYDQNGQLYSGSATIPGYGGLYLRSYNVNANFYSALRVKARDNKTIVGAAWTDTWSGHMGDAMMPPASTTAMPYLWKNYAYDGLARSDMRHLHTTSGNRN